MGTKRALLVGINLYKLPGNNLQGCVNDVNDVRNLLLSKYGFGPQDITMLTDRQATKANMVASLKALVASGADSMVFHYSGHGSEVQQTDGHVDQCLCPQDMMDYSTVLLDEEIAGILNGLPLGAKLYFVSDSCHSGTVDRDILMHSNPHPAKARFMAVPGYELAVHHTQGRRSLVNFLTPRAAAGIHLLLSGCRDDQPSADAYFNGVYNGALTKSVLVALGASPTQNWNQLHDAVVSWMQQNHFEQEPQLSGPIELTSQAVFA